MFDKSSEPKPLTEREELYEKGRALMLMNQYQLAEPIFFNLVSFPESEADSVYSPSLWYMSLIHEKMGAPDKAILTLNQLVSLPADLATRFKVKASLMKNYYLVGNRVDALRLKKEIDQMNLQSHLKSSGGEGLEKLDPKTLHQAISEVLYFNYDHLIVEELAFLTEFQKYVLYVMEQNDSAVNAQATEQLISIYQRAYDQAQKSSLKPAFKEKIMVALLDGLRRFDIYKINDLNINLKTVSKFSLFSEKMQKQITEWLHQ